MQSPCRRSAQFVLNYGRVLPVNHEHRLLQFQPVDLVHEHRERVLTELLEVHVALRMDDAGISIAREVETPALDDERLFQLGKKDHSADRRLGRGHQQTVVTPGIQPGDGRRGEPADPVGLQPLAADGDVQIAAHRLIELAHLSLLTRSRVPAPLARSERGRAL